MTPLALIECLKLTYNLELARTVTKAMVEKTYPHLRGRPKIEMQMAVAEGLQFSARMVAEVADWDEATALEFVQRYETEFHKKGESLYHYVMVEDLFNKIIYRLLELSPTPPEALPHWLKMKMRHVAREREQAATNQG